MLKKADNNFDHTPQLVVTPGFTATRRESAMGSKFYREFKRTSKNEIMRKVEISLPSSLFIRCMRLSLAKKISVSEVFIYALEIGAVALEDESTSS